MNDIVKEKLDNFIFKKNIPHILFHGENISRCIQKLNYLLDNIYTDYNTHKENTLYVNSFNLRTSCFKSSKIFCLFPAFLNSSLRRGNSSVK